MRSERVSEKVEAFLWRLSISLCVNGLGCDVGVEVGFFVGVEAVFLLLLGMVCKGKGAVPLPFHPRREELRCVMPTGLIWVSVCLEVLDARLSFAVLQVLDLPTTLLAFIWVHLR